MVNTVVVDGIKLYAYHGCLPEEEKIGGHYIVNVAIDTNFEASFSSDDLIDTVDYVLINQIVKEEMAIRSKLIEHVGYRIVSRFKKEIKGIKSIKIEVKKVCPPIGGDVDSVSIIISEDF